ncbi:hypothetical protein VCV18_004768 [Metarhizium anisopliae]
MEEAPSGHASQLVVQAMRCQNILKDLLSNCEQNDVGHQKSNFLSAQSARLNSWCVKTGIYEPGEHSLDYHLKGLPQTKITITKLLWELRCAEPELREPESIDEHATSKMQSQQDCDEDSDTSEWSRDSLPVSHDRDTHPRPNRKWTRIERNIHKLYMQARLDELDGENDMQTRIERFKNETGQNQVYELFKTMAREKAEHQFPRSPLWMQERIAESFARRRMRFEYLKHQEKLACGLHHESPPQPQNDATGTTLTTFPETDTQVNKPGSQNTTPRAGNRGVILSATENTRLDTISSPRTTESVASLTMGHHDLPYRPKLQESGTYTCPYCFLVIPPTEAEGIPWSQHVMRDLEPYFCVFKDCSKPFDVHNSFDGVLAHMHDSHVAVPYWWSMPDGSRQEFKNRDLFDQFLEQELDLPRSEFDSLRAIFRRKEGFRFATCHFCGCYPEKFRRCLRWDTPFAQEEMRKHIKQHMEEIALYLLPVMDDVVDDAPGEDNMSDDAVGTQRHGLDELSAVTWRTTPQQEHCDSEDRMESMDTVDGQLQSDFEMEAQPSHPGEKNNGLERSKENKNGDKSAQGRVAWSDWSKWPSSSSPE